MIANPTRGSLLRIAVLVAAVVTVGWLDAPTVSAKHPDETPATANAFLDRFIGRWIGEGTANGSPISDDLSCQRILVGTFLFMEDREIGGGNFQADTYVGYSAEEKRFELYTFNNNTGFSSSLPVRVMTGHRDGEKLVMEEKGHGGLQYTFEFLDQDTFRLTKAFAKGHSEPPFVTEIFSRQ